MSVKYPVKYRDQVVGYVWNCPSGKGWGAQWAGQVIPRHSATRADAEERIFDAQQKYDETNTDTVETGSEGDN